MMTADEFEIIVTDAENRRRVLRNVKRSDYDKGDDDRLSSFRGENQNKQRGTSTHQEDDG